MVSGAAVSGGAVTGGAVSGGAVAGGDVVGGAVAGGAVVEGAESGASTTVPASSSSTTRCGSAGITSSNEPPSKLPRPASDNRRAASVSESGTGASGTDSTRAPAENSSSISISASRSLALVVSTTTTTATSSPSLLAPDASSTGTVTSVASAHNITPMGEMAGREDDVLVGRRGLTDCEPNGSRHQTATRGPPTPADLTKSGSSTTSQDPVVGRPSMP